MAAAAGEQLSFDLALAATLVPTVPTAIYCCTFFWQMYLL